MEHRQGFSSEATVLISCSLNVIMVMITQMTPGLWGIHGSHILTEAAQALWLHWPAYQTTRLSQSWWPAPVLLYSLDLEERRVNDQINSSRQQKSCTAMREMDIFCCLTLSAVFQSNYLSLLQPLLSQCMALKPAWIQTQTPNKNVVD